MVDYVRVMRVEPELYFHFVLNRRHEIPVASLRRTLQQAAHDSFVREFPSEVLSFDIELLPGSIRGWIRTRQKALAGMIGAAAVGLSQYGDIRQGSETFYGDVRLVLTIMRDEVVTAFQSDFGGIRERIRTERRIGAVAQFDELTHRYQRGEIDRDEYFTKGRAIMGKIVAEVDIPEVVAPLREYLEIRYPQTFDWQPFRAVAEGSPWRSPPVPTPLRGEPNPNRYALPNEDRRGPKQLPPPPR